MGFPGGAAPRGSPVEFGMLLPVLLAPATGGVIGVDALGKSEELAFRASGRGILTA
jgi:hypothetical protein